MQSTPQAKRPTLADILRDHNEEQALRNPDALCSKCHKPTSGARVAFRGVSAKAAHEASGLCACDVADRPDAQAAADQARADQSDREAAR